MSLARNLLCTALAACATASAARVTRIVVDETAPLPGGAIAYERIAGRAFGELDPASPRNAIVQDIQLASAWQGDNAGTTTVRARASVSGMQWLRLPVARGANGERITGEVLGRIV